MYEDRSINPHYLFCEKDGVDSFFIKEPPEKCEKTLMKGGSFMKNQKYETVYIYVDEVCKIMGISKPTAYKVIHQLNDELKNAGYITIAGRTNREYFYKKVGITESIGA